MVVGVGVGRGESEPGGGKNGRERGGEEEEPFSYTVAYFFFSSIQHSSLVGSQKRSDSQSSIKKNLFLCVHENASPGEYNCNFHCSTESQRTISQTLWRRKSFEGPPPRFRLHTFCLRPTPH